MTRWITNLCAPVFILLAGTSAYIHFRHRQSKSELCRHLVTRGLFIILMEQTIIRFSFCFNLNYFLPQTNLLHIFWAIGWSMIALAFLIYLPLWLISAIGLIMVFGHNLFDGINPASLGAFQTLWIILHSPGNITVWPGLPYRVLYPLIPWIGVMALGFVFGHITDWQEEKRKKVFLPLSIVMLGLFVIIRGINIYGDPVRWAHQKNALFTFLSFINVTKYPPSLLYLLLTLGLSMLIFNFIRTKKGAWMNYFTLFGQVPFFYYIIHFYVIHLLIIVFAVIQYKKIPWWLFHDNPYCNLPAYPSAPADFGYGLITVYIVWIAVIIILHPMCRWYLNYKKTHSNFITGYV